MEHGHIHDHADVHTEHCECGCGAEHSEQFEQTKNVQGAKMVIAAVFFAAGYIISEFTALPDFIYLICFAVSYMTVGFAVVREAVEDIMHGRIFGECFLISAASLGALAIKEFSEGCAVMLLFALGEFIQEAMLSKSRKAIRALSDEHGFEHSHSNSDTERFISKFARIYTPIICALAIAVIVIPPVFAGGEWKEWVHRGLSALVIGCPCAIVISVPLAFSCAMGACAREGIFVHCSNALEALYRNNDAEGDIVFADGDKTDFAKKAAKKAMTVSRENVTFALAVKLVILVLAVFMNKEVPMWLAEFGDVGVAVLAILNSLRALRIK